MTPLAAVLAAVVMALLVLAVAPAATAQGPLGGMPSGPAPGPVTGTTTFDFVDFEWISLNADTVDTAHLGADFALIPGTLILRGAASYSYALGEIHTRNPFGAPTLGSAAQDATATAQRFPAFEDTLIRLDAAGSPSRRTTGGPTGSIPSSRVSRRSSSATTTGTMTRTWWRSRSATSSGRPRAAAPRLRRRRPTRCAPLLPPPAVIA